MRDLEVRLRQGMTDATRPVQAMPALAVRVVARVAQRRRRRRLAAIVISVAAAVLVAIGVVSPPNRPDPVAVHPELEGVRIGYLPAGLGAPTRLRVQEARLRGEALRWQAGGGDFVQVSAYRVDDAITDAMGILSLNVVDAPVEPRTTGDPVLSGDGTSAMWVADHRLVLKVTVPPGLKGERDRIIGGLRVVGWNPDFGGLRVTYMPANMWISGMADTYGVDALNRFWQGDSGRRVTMEVVHGRAAATLDKLGVPKTWLLKPGVGVRLSADNVPQSELMRIAEGIQVPPDGQGGSVDGIMTSFGHPGPVKIATATGWRSVTRKWADQKVTVSVHRGVRVMSQTWWESLTRGNPESATVAGRRGNLLNPETFVWAPEAGLAIVVTAPARDLQRIVKGVEVP